jgi:hypothetical protein
MKKQVFRLNGSHRMTALVYRSDLEASVEYTAKVMSDWARDNMIPKAPTVDQL